AREGRAEKIHAARASLADPARPLYLRRAQAKISGMSGAPGLRIQGEVDARGFRPWPNKIGQAQAGREAKTCGESEARGQAQARRPPRRLNPEHVLHRIEARLLAGEPLRCRDRAACEDAPAGGAMRELDHLAIGGEDHAMLAGIVAAAQGREADIAALPRAGDAVARALALGRKIDLAPLGRGL